MLQVSKDIHLETRGEVEVVDLTARVQEVVAASGARLGQSLVLKPDLLVPVRDGTLDLGTWQQVVFVVLDDNPRRRRVVVNEYGL